MIKMTAKERDEIKNEKMKVMESKLNERQLKRYNDMPKAHKYNYCKAVLGSKICAIKAQCLECVQWEREEIKLCPSISCPLFNHRPYK